MLGLMNVTHLACVYGTQSLNSARRVELLGSSFWRGISMYKGHRITEMQ